MTHDLATRFTPGDRVRLTGEFLRNTGQLVGGEGHSRWIVLACDCGLCKTGDFVCTNQRRSSADMFTAEEIAGDPSLGWRHINVGNLERCR